MAKTAKAHVSGQHALSCTVVHAGQLLAAEWRLKHGNHPRTELDTNSTFGASVSARLAEWKEDCTYGAPPAASCMSLGQAPRSKSQVIP